MDCKECHERFRADKLIEDFCAENNITLEESVDAWSQEKMKAFVDEHNVPVLPAASTTLPISDSST